MGLSAEAISITLGGRAVLDEVTARFEPGRITAILGPNGAGKTSLLRCLAGLLKPTRGSVTLDGRPLSAMPPRDRARTIGYLPQSAELAWNVPAREVVLLGRHAHRSPFAAPDEKDRAAVERAMAITDTAHFADRLTGELSGGERARVLLARVLAGEPRWLLADEPLASLDPAHQFDILDRLKAAAHAGQGVIVVLHDLHHAARIADDVLLLKAGRLVEAGATADVLNGPLLARVFGISVEIAHQAEGGIRVHIDGRTRRT